MRPYERVQLSDHQFNRTEGNFKYHWDVTTLISYAKEKKYKVFDMPIDGIPLSGRMWRLDNMDNFCYHAHRVFHADLKYPILIDDLGDICDGWHRVMKAIIEGKKHIKAIRLETMPSPSATENI